MTRPLHRLTTDCWSRSLTSQISAAITVYKYNLYIQQNSVVNFVDLVLRKTSITEYTHSKPHNNKGVSKMAFLKFALLLVSAALLMMLAMWIYRWPQRKLTKKIEEDWEKDPLKLH